MNRSMHPTSAYVFAMIAVAIRSPLGDAAAGSSRTWAKADFPDTESCEAIVFDREDPKRLVLGTRPSGLWESLDGGRTWSRQPTIMPSALRFGFNTGSIAAHPRVRGLWYAGVERHGAYRSRDGGRSWEPISNGLGKGNERNGICFAFDAREDATVFYGADLGIFKSSDGGDHWSKCTRGLPKGQGGNTTVSRMATDPVSGAVYAAFYAVGKDELPGIYQSADGGETWQCVNRGIESGPDEEIMKAVRTASERLAGAKTDQSLTIAGGWRCDKAWAFDVQLSPLHPKVLFAATYQSLNDPPKPGKPPKLMDLGNGLKGYFSETTDTFSVNLVTFDPTGRRMIALTSQGLWTAEVPEAGAP